MNQLVAILMLIGFFLLIGIIAGVKFALAGSPRAYRAIIRYPNGRLRYKTLRLKTTDATTFDYDKCSYDVLKSERATTGMQNIQTAIYMHNVRTPISWNTINSLATKNMSARDEYVRKHQNTAQEIITSLKGKILQQMQNILIIMLVILVIGFLATGYNNHREVENLDKKYEVLIPVIPDVTEVP